LLYVYSSSPHEQSLVGDSLPLWTVSYYILTVSCRLNLNICMFVLLYRRNIQGQSLTTDSHLLRTVSFSLNFKISLYLSSSIIQLSTHKPVSYCGQSAVLRTVSCYPNFQISVFSPCSIVKVSKISHLLRTVSHYGQSPIVQISKYLCIYPDLLLKSPRTVSYLLRTVSHYGQFSITDSLLLRTVSYNGQSPIVRISNICIFVLLYH
jgi:hypothetical protein